MFRYIITALCLVLVTHWTTAQKTKYNTYFSETSELSDSIGPHVFISVMDSMPMPGYYADQDMRDSVSHQYSNTWEAALAIEKYFIGSMKGTAERKNGFLQLTKEDGSVLILKNDDKKEESGHSLEYYFEDPGLFLVRVQWAEGNGYKLVNRNTGIIIEIPGRPYFSPDKSRFVVINRDLEAEYSYSGIMLFEYENGIWQPVWEYSPGQYGAVACKWVDNNSFICKGETLMDGEINGTLIKTGFLKFVLK